MNAVIIRGFNSDIIFDNSLKVRYGDIDTDYDRACEDGLIKPHKKTLEQQISWQKSRLARWQKNTPKTPTQVENKIFNIKNSSIKLQNLLYEQKRVSVEISKISKAKYSPTLIQALFDNKARYDSKQAQFKIGDKVHVLNDSRDAFMQTIYTKRCSCEIRRL